MGLGCRTIGIVGWVVLGSILPLRSLGLNPMPKQLIKNIRRGETPQKRAEILGKNAFEVFWKERNWFFKELIQTEEPTTEQTDIPEPSLSDLYKTALRKSFSYLEGIYGQPLPAEQHDELFNAVLEQILPFVNAIHRMDAFLAPFTNNPQEVFERLQTISTDYQNALSIDEYDIYGPSFRQFYYKLNMEGGRFQQIGQGGRANELFRYAREFLAKTYGTIHETHSEIPTTDITQALGRIAAQVLFPVASRYGVLWAILGKFRKNNKESTEDLERELPLKAPQLLHLKDADTVKETFWQQQAQQILSDCRQAAHDYVNIFQKKLLFRNLGSPVDVL